MKNHNLEEKGSKKQPEIQNKSTNSGRKKSSVIAKSSHIEQRQQSK